MDLDEGVQAGRRPAGSVAAALDKRAPMGAAPLKYQDDGRVDWGNMWDSFCALAQEGGPPHRGTLLTAPPIVDSTSPAYSFAVAEICRGIVAVSELRAAPADAGWIAVTCCSPGQARWLAAAIREENVEARTDGARLLLPVAEHYTLKGEIKNVITVVAKSTHYWQEHVPVEVQRALDMEVRLAAWGQRVRSWLRRQTA